MARARERKEGVRESEIIYLPDGRIMIIIK